MRRRLPAVAAAALLLLLAGCASAGESAAPSASAPSVTPPPTASAAPSPSGTPDPAPTGDGAALPESCERVWSPAALSILSEEAGTADDSGVTMLSTEVVPALEVLDAVPSLRCTWGGAGGPAIATTVAIVDDAQEEAVRSALLEAGLSCDEGDPVTRCERRQDLAGDGGQGSTAGEVHLVGGGRWVASHWIDLDLEPEYSDDILATLWG